MNSDDNNMEEIRKILKNRMAFMVTNDLTIGRTYNDRKPFTSNEIEKFIKENDGNMEQAIESMIYQYKEDDELELLNDPLNDWVSDYLYIYVDTCKANIEEFHNMEEIRKILKNRMKFIITNDLTIGRTDNDEEPFTSNEIEKIIKENDDNMEQAIESMIYQYKEDDELELLNDPLNDWISDYLYNYVDLDDMFTDYKYTQ